MYFTIIKWHLEKSDDSHMGQRYGHDNGTVTTPQMCRVFFSVALCASAFTNDVNFIAG